MTQTDLFQPKRPISSSRRIENPADATAIQLGQRVRSYDFEHLDDCYVEGVVVAIGTEVEGCPRYEIFADRRIASGRALELGDEPEDRTFFPPVNGTRSWLGGYTNFVQPIAAANEEGR